VSRLLASLDAPPSGRFRPVWFDAVAYGRARLLGGGDLPWQAPAELTSFFGKTQAMFGSDAVLADVADVFAQRAAADQALRAAMAARSRPGYALRTLLGDERARADAADAVGALAATKGAVPLVLTVPAPGRWLAAAAAQAHPGAAPPEAGQAETAAMYSADFLRTFGDAGVDGLLLDEGPVPAGQLTDPEAYRPVLNVAEHYGWPVLIRTEAAAAWPHGPVPGVALWIGSAVPAPVPAPVPADTDAAAGGGAPGRWGVVAGPDFWADADPPADADLVLAQIPAQADPEAVMKRVRALT
jgi:hypothetical protein